jgi:starvation-inducible DNA-binding protein
MPTTRIPAPADRVVRSTLDEEAMAAVQSRLQPLLVDLLDLALTGKQLHWTVVGENFRPIHEHLDELVVEYRGWADDVAERMSSVGIAPDGRSERVAGDSPADPAPEGWIHQSDVVAVMADRVEAAAKATRRRLEGLGEIDSASEDLLIEVLNGLEMQLWMISAQQA